MFDRYLTGFASIPHLLFTALLALIVAALIAGLGKRTIRQRLLHSAWFFACSMGTVVAGSWIMYWIHG